MKNNSLMIPETEQVDHICTELDGIFSVARDFVSGMATEASNKARWLAGKEIITSSTYKKYSKGSKAMIDEIARRRRWSAATIYSWIHLYEQYPDSKFELSTPWRELRAKLKGEDAEEKALTKPVTCRHCPKHWPKACPK